MAALNDPAHASCVEGALEAVAAGAAERDRHPRFPDEAFAELRAAGLLALTLPRPDGERVISHADEWHAVRSVARADGSVGRIYDGHLNAVERLAVAAAEPLRSEELDA
ncbi:MAG: acyl-CoA dehydrogenase family protein, partial [Thermoleophilaceae bacterium]|nr:acyl-CoA dehydrogenase family protein [Thermoleophilaceae bacterium]